MYGVYTSAQIRAAEEASGQLLISGALMQRAASGLAAAVVRELRAGPPGRRPGRLGGRRVLLAVGSGNNGGDALWAAVRWLRRGVRVDAWRCGAAVHEAGWAAFRAAGGGEVDALGALAALPDTDLVVDGVLGIGGRGGLRAPVALFADACRVTGTPVVAVDLPSGLEADAAGPAAEDGEEAAAFSADLTVTFGAPKPCHALQPARTRCGRVEVVDIGLELGEPALTAWEPVDVAARWPVLRVAADKYARGVVGVDTGSQRYPGAAVLSVLGAVHAGAGMVRYLGSAGAAVVAAAPNVVTASGRVQAWLLGCGWGDRADGREVVAGVLAAGVPAVLDADAIGMLPRGRLRTDVLLTPHAGELARLLGVERRRVEADPVAAAREAAETTGATVLLKGASQCVAEPSGRVTLAVGGPAWTAQAGSGDTLAGMCAAVLAAGRTAQEAALLGASIQAMTAAAHPGPRPPQELARLVPGVVAGLAMVSAGR